MPSIQNSLVRTIRTMSDIGDSLSLTYRLLETSQSELPNLVCTYTWPLCQLCILKPPVFSDFSQLVSHKVICQSSPFTFKYQVSPDQTFHPRTVLTSLLID